MTPGQEMAMVLAKIDAWLREKEYASGHRTGELLKEAAAAQGVLFSPAGVAAIGGGQ